MIIVRKFIQRRVNLTDMYFLLRMTDRSERLQTRPLSSTAAG